MFYVAIQEVFKINKYIVSNLLIKNIFSAQNIFIFKQKNFQYT